MRWFSKSNFSKGVTWGRGLKKLPLKLIYRFLIQQEKTKWEFFKTALFDVYEKSISYHYNPQSQMANVSHPGYDNQLQQFTLVLVIEFPRGISTFSIAISH